MIYNIVFILLFLLGLYAILTNRNLVKIIIGVNIMESAVFFWVIAVNSREGVLPILEKGSEIIQVANPIPQALILTGVVIGASTTAFLLTLLIEIDKFANNINLDFLKGLRD